MRGNGARDCAFRMALLSAVCSQLLRFVPNVWSKANRIVAIVSSVLAVRIALVVSKMANRRKTANITRTPEIFC